MSTAHSGASAAEVRAKLGYPIVDADAHVIECGFAIQDFIAKVGGKDMAAKYDALGKANRGGTPYRQVFWASPSGPHTIDRVTVMLPKLYAQRLDEAGSTSPSSIRATACAQCTCAMTNCAAWRTARSTCSMPTCSIR